MQAGVSTHVFFFLKLFEGLRNGSGHKGVGQMSDVGSDTEFWFRLLRRQIIINSILTFQIIREVYLLR